MLLLCDRHGTHYPSQHSCPQCFELLHEPEFVDAEAAKAAAPIYSVPDFQGVGLPDISFLWEDGWIIAVVVRWLEGVNAFPINGQGPYLRETGYVVYISPVPNERYLDYTTAQPPRYDDSYSTMCVRARHIPMSVVNSLPERPWWAFLPEREAREKTQRATRDEVLRLRFPDVHLDLDEMLDE